MNTGGAAPRPVVLASPGTLSDPDFATLSGLTVSDKILQMRAILTEVAATRTPQQLALRGPFRWDEAAGTRGEYLFIGQAPPTLKLHTVVVIKADGKVYKMWPAGLTGLVSQGRPRVVAYDLLRGNGQLMVS